jgi:serralysin
VNLWINLDTKAHTLGAISVGAAPTTAQTEKESSGLNFGDKVIGFEDVHGGDAGNVIYGSAKANGLTGGAAGDNLLGEGGNDTLHGGGGADGLAGGAGKDLLFGEAGGDFFQFLSTRDSGLSTKTRDVIMDWESGDHIAVQYIDANTKKAGNQAFSFLATEGAAFTKHAGPNGEGELRYFHSGTQTIVQGDVNHDGKADFSIAINALVALSATDFDL